MRSIQERERPWLEPDRIDAKCNLLLGGQIDTQEPELYMIYSQGNFIQAIPETPFLQIGETKYGKPILDRTMWEDYLRQAFDKVPQIEWNPDENLDRSNLQTTSGESSVD